jgi:hypothetical protein
LCPALSAQVRFIAPIGRADHPIGERSHLFRDRRGRIERLRIALARDRHEDRAGDRALRAVRLAPPPGVGNVREVIVRETYRPTLAA